MSLLNRPVKVFAHLATGITLRGLWTVNMPWPSPCPPRSDAEAGSWYLWLFKAHQEVTCSQDGHRAELHSMWWWFSTKSCSDSWDPVDCSLLGSSVHGILQARILEWVAISFSRGSSRPRNRTRISCNAARFFTNWATREVFTVAGGDFNWLSLWSLRLKWHTLYMTAVTGRF